MLSNNFESKNLPKTDSVRSSSEVIRIICNWRRILLFSIALGILQIFISLHGIAEDHIKSKARPTDEDCTFTHRFGEIESLVSNGEYKDSLQICNALLKDYPNCSEAHYFRAIAYFYLKRLQNAANDIEIAISLRSDAAAFWERAATIHESLGELKKALNDLTKAIQLKSLSTNGHVDERLVDRARIYLKLGMDESALPDLNTFLSRIDSRAEAHFWRAVYYERHKSFHLAAKDYSITAHLCESFEDTANPIYKRSLVALKRLHYKHEILTHPN